VEGKSEFRSGVGHKVVSKFGPEKIGLDGPGLSAAFFLTIMRGFLAVLYLFEDF